MKGSRARGRVLLSMTLREAQLLSFVAFEFGATFSEAKAYGKEKKFARDLETEIATQIITPPRKKK